LLQKAVPFFISLKH